MADASSPIVSFILAAHNRREVVLRTLAQVKACGLERDRFETFLIDNASSDGTADAVAAAHPDVCLIRQRGNRGPCARNLALPLARGQFIVFLDDDSYPMPGSVQRMIEHFDAEARLGAASFTVTLPDGSRECSAYPNVFIGCGVGLRRTALVQVGGLPEDFFMAAEEYDLSLRLLAAGWDVLTLDDLHVSHLKTPGARSATRLTRLDTRNNLILIARYFPERWVWPYARDWMRRYGMMAAVKGQRIHHWRGMAEGVARIVQGVGRRPLDEATFQKFSRIDQTRQRMRTAAKRHGLRSVLMVDLGKNMLAYRLAARELGLRIVGIADQMLGGRGFRYDGVPILTDDDAAQLRFDAAIVSNLSPVHAELRRQQWRARHARPVIDLFEPDAFAKPG
jgi:GT2 family glycosyltransferase